MSLEKVSREFELLFGERPTIVAAAPGRVNLIGEHTDYNDGFVFPAAIDRFVWVAASVSAAPQYASLELTEGEQEWTKYPEGVAWVLRHMGYEIPPLRALVTSDVPIGAGVSSSAALELAFGVVWNELGSLGLSKPTLAQVGQRCENEFIGLKTGLMDQMASAMGRAGHAMFYDTRNGEIEYAPIPADVSIVVADTTKSRELAASKYNDRRAECEAAASAMGVSSLREASIELLEASGYRMTDACYRRAQHVLSENARCLAFAKALEAGQLDELSFLMHESHESLRVDYEVSCDELDAMAECCWDSPGCIGARMTGAGFGGACVVLVETDLVEDFTANAASGFRKRTGLEGKFMTCLAADGARRVA